MTGMCRRKGIRRAQTLRNMGEDPSNASSRFEVTVLATVITLQRRSVMSVQYYDEHHGDHSPQRGGLNIDDFRLIWTNAVCLEPFCQLLPKGASVLDAGSGSGRDSLFFAQKGFQVTAIDASRSRGQPRLKLTTWLLRTTAYLKSSNGRHMLPGWRSVKRAVLPTVLIKLRKSKTPGTAGHHFRLRDQTRSVRAAGRYEIR